MYKQLKEIENSLTLETLKISYKTALINEILPAIFNRNRSCESRKNKKYHIDT